MYMVDVYDGRFPSSRPNVFSRSKDNADGEQEERRLFYVGITRAKNNLNLFSISNRPSSYVEELFPEIQEKREEEKRIKAEFERKTREDYLKRQQIEQEKERARKQAEFEARQRELEERRRKEAEELARQRALEDQRCRDEILKIIDQQDYQARDSLDRRWVRCEKCGEIKLEKEFSSYGGPNHINLGICSICSRKSN